MTRLSILGASVEISCDDDELQAFIRELWSPFLIEDGGGTDRAVVIRKQADGHLMRSIRGPSYVYSDVWKLLFTLRYHLGQAAADAFPGVVIHGAWLSRGARCVIVAGGSGTGKTTAACRLVHEGWACGSDDYAPSIGEGALLACPKPFKVPPHAELPERTRFRIPSSWPEPSEAMLVPAAEVGRIARSGARPTEIAFLDRSLHEPVDISSTECVYRLAGNVASKLDRHRLGLLSVIGRHSRAVVVADAADWILTT